MSTFTFGFVMSKLKKCNVGGLKTPRISNLTALAQPEIEIWTLADRQIQFKVRNYLIAPLAEIPVHQLGKVIKEYSSFWATKMPCSGVDLSQKD